MEQTFFLEAMVRGYHVYQAIWEAALLEELPCQREVGNRHDPFAVAVVKANITVGHVPRKISSVCSIFLRRGGSITCQVTGGRRFSEDLSQGGLEIPCVLKFCGGVKETSKAEKLLKSSLDLEGSTGSVITIKQHTDSSVPLSCGVDNKAVSPPPKKIKYASYPESPPS